MKEFGKLNKRSLSAFDLDHTLIAGNCSYHFGRFLYQNNLLSRSRALFLCGCYLLHKRGVISLRRLHKMVCRTLFDRFFRAEIEELADRFMQTLPQSFFSHPGAQYLKAAKKRGDWTLILSSSPDFLVSRFASRFEADCFAGTTYFHHPAWGVRQVMGGDEKALFTRAFAEERAISRSSVAAYSDSSADLPFLEAAGIPIAICPDKRLRRVCVKKQWKVVS